MFKEKSFVLFISAILLSLCSTALYAIEPENIQITKNTLIQYHDSGAYEQDINAIVYQAQAYLSEVAAEQEKQQSKEKLAVIFDIDETSLSNYANMRLLNFGGSVAETDRLIAQEKNAPAISATLSLYRQALKEHVHVFFVTGRYDNSSLRKNTIQNLHVAGFEQYDGLMMKPTDYNQPSASIYKTAMRKKITEQGYHIILNIGDQMSDLGGGYADKTYKLPNPYYYIP